MLLLGVDFETTFTDPVDVKQARIIESGAVVYDPARKLPLLLVNRVVYAPDYDALYDDRIKDLTGLTLDDLKTYGQPPKDVLFELCMLIEKSDYVVAHNGTGFDKPLLQAECERHGVQFPKTLWLDTVCDVAYPKKIETRKLDFLAPVHGFLNPFAHRALFDVLSMLKVLGSYDINEVVTRSTAQKVTVRALTQMPWKDGGKSNQTAKERGFKFDGASKHWLKIVLETELEKELTKSPLEVVRYK